MATQFLFKLPISLMIIILLSAVPRGAEAGVVWSNFLVSTGDNQWNHELFPLDGPKTIDAAFEAMASFGAKRVYWRGEQDRVWLDDYVFRPEIPLYYGYWEWMRYLNRTVKTNELAVSSARRHGLQIFYFDGLFEYGSQGDAPGCGTFPYQTEDRVRITHPEWVLCDRWGERRSPGPIEYAYPEARKHLIDKVMRHVKDFDGVVFYTYAENFGYRYPEEFGFNAPVVEEFKKRYGVDIRTQEFDKDAWYKLRGEYVTQTLRELHSALSKKGKKLSIIIWAEQPNVPMGWGRYSTWTTIGPVHMDYEKWVLEGIVDELLVYHNDEKLVLKLVDIARGSRTSIVVLGEATQAESKAGVTSMVDIWQAVCGNLVTPQAVTESDIASPDWARRVQVLINAAGGSLKLDADAVVKAAADSHPLVRRQAIRTLAAMKAADKLPVIEAALGDRENCVRTAAAAALASVNGPESASKLFEALRKNGMFQMRSAALVSLKGMLPGSEGALIAGLTDKSEAVREVSARALEAGSTQKSQSGLLKSLEMDEDYRVRHWSLISLIARKDDAYRACLLAFEDPSTTVQLAAVRGLGKIAPGMTHLQSARTLETLARFFKEYGDGCRRSDAAWGWRVVGNAIAAFGEKGKGRLEEFRSQREDKWLAWAAYQVLYIPQADDEASLTTEKEAVETHSKYAPLFPGWRVDKLD